MDYLAYTKRLVLGIAMTLFFPLQLFSSHIYCNVFCVFLLIAIHNQCLKFTDQETSLPLEVEIKSGMAYLLYQSTSTDLSTGFNISYFADSCLHDCYGHGNCVGERFACSEHLH